VLELLRNAVVNSIPTQFFFKVINGGIFINHRELNLCDACKVLPRFKRKRCGQYSVVRCTGRQPARCGDRKRWRRFPNGTRNRQVWQGLIWLHNSDLVSSKTETVTQVRHRNHNALPWISIKDQTNRILAVTNPKWMNLQLWLCLSQARADFKHVCAEDLLTARNKVIGVILHEAGSTGQAIAHDLRDTNENASLLVTFSTKSIAIGHQPLYCETGQLAQSTKVFEGVSECTGIFALEDSADTSFLFSCVSQCIMAFPALCQGWLDFVESLIFIDKRVDLRIGDFSQLCHEIVNAPGIY